MTHPETLTCEQPDCQTLGRLILNSIGKRDYAMVQGLALFIAVIFVVVNLAVDLLYTAVDPRISYAGKD